MVKKPFVYIAGPISKGDHPINIRNGVDAYDHVLRLGAIPFCPMLDFLYRIVYPNGTDYEGLLDMDFQVILRCDALLRIPGESPGADREVAFAKEHNIPVFDNWESFAMWVINYGEKDKSRNCCGYSN